MVEARKLLEPVGDSDASADESSDAEGADGKS